MTHKIHILGRDKQLLCHTLVAPYLYERIVAPLDDPEFCTVCCAAREAMTDRSLIGPIRVKVLEAPHGG